MHNYARERYGHLEHANAPKGIHAMFYVKEHDRAQCAKCGLLERPKPVDLHRKVQSILDTADDYGMTIINTLGIVQDGKVRLTRYSMSTAQGYVTMTFDGQNTAYAINMRAVDDVPKSFRKFHQSKAKALTLLTELWETQNAIDRLTEPVPCGF